QFRKNGWSASVALILWFGGQLPAATEVTEAERKRVAQLEQIRLQKANLKDGQFDVAGADQAYAAAFRDHGIDVGKLDPAQAAERIRKQAIRAELVAALDDWAAARRAASKGNDKAWQHLVAVARAADADGWRNRLREAWQRSDRKLLVEMAGKAEAA